MFRPSTWNQPARDIAKEYNAWDAAETAPEAIPTEPEELSKSLVRRGVLDPNTGFRTGNSKQDKILLGNIRGFSPRAQDNYERIFGHS